MFLRSIEKRHFIIRNYVILVSLLHHRFTHLYVLVIEFRKLKYKIYGWSS